MNANHLDLLLRSAANSPRILSLAGGLPAPETFPRRQIAEAAHATILSMGTAPLQHDWPEGRQSLRELVATRLRRRGADVEAADVLITNGAQDALALAIEVLAPASVQVDPRTYPGAIDVFRAHGCRVTPTVEAVRYVLPALSNPDGEIATRADRQRMLESRWILEDDAYADLVFENDTEAPLIAHARAQVFHVGTFSKVLSPGLRVGWLVPPRAWLRRARDAKMRRDLHACGLAQAIVERLLHLLDYDARLDHLRALYRHRCDHFVSALRAVDGLRFHVAAGGFSLWAELDRPTSEAALLEGAIAEGVSFDPGSRFRYDGGEQPLAMRLSYSVLDEAEFPEAAHRLGRAIDRLSHPRAA